MHSEFLLVGAEDVEVAGQLLHPARHFAAGYTPEAVRYLLASVPYRKALNFTFDGLKSADTAIDRVRNFELRLETEKLPEGQTRQMTSAPKRRSRISRKPWMTTSIRPRRLAAVFEYIREINTADGPRQFPRRQQGTAKSVAPVRSVFDVLNPRHHFRPTSATRRLRQNSKNAGEQEDTEFGFADQIRDSAAPTDIILEDTKDGVR